MPDFSPSVLRGSPFFEFKRTINRIFDEFSHEMERPARRRDNPAPWGSDFFEHTWQVVDMREGDNEIRLTAELPGVNREDLEVSVSNDRLTIRGEKKKQQEKSDRVYYRLERYEADIWLD
jgi:HSP20 family protein